MVLVLAIGDLHIPLRKGDLPPKFKALLLPGKIQHILCPGDLCVKVRRRFRRCFFVAPCSPRSALLPGGAGILENHLQRPAHHARRVRQGELPRDEGAGQRDARRGFSRCFFPAAPGAQHRRLPLRPVPRPPGALTFRLPPHHSLMPNIPLFPYFSCPAQVTPWGDADSLASLARTLDVDVLVSGHTGEFRAARHGDRCVWAHIPMI